VLSSVRIDAVAVFVQHSVHIGSPILAVSVALAQGPNEWFPRLEESGIAAVGPVVAGIGIRKNVDVEFGEPLAAGSWTEVPVTWRARSVPHLFPVMTGKIELSPVDSRNTRLTVCGMYRALSATWAGFWTARSCTAWQRLQSKILRSRSPPASGLLFDPRAGPNLLSRV